MTDAVRPRQASLVTMVGVDGAGKSTLAYRLKEVLGASRKLHVAERMETFARDVAGGIAHPKSASSYFGVFAYEFAKALDMVRNHFDTVEPLLRTDTLVICPRSVENRLAAARLAGIDEIERLADVLRLIPDAGLVLRLRVAPEIALERIAARGRDRDVLDRLVRLEDMLDAFKPAGGWVEIDAGGDGDSVLIKARQAIECHLG